MAFANFFVSEGEITKQYKGCYRNSGKGPAPGDRGTISGSWQPSPVSNIVPILHNSIKGLYIYPAQTGGWVKMVGMQYGGPQGPVRVDGRAYSPIVSLNSENVSNAWNNAQDKGIGNSEYKLTITNVTPKTSVSECMTEANNNNVSVFSVSNLTKNNMAQCLTGSQVNENESNLILNIESDIDEFFDIDNVNQSIDEKSCLTRSDANTVYTIINNGPNSDILGKTYLSKKEKGSDKVSLYEYPESMLKMGREFKQMPNFASEGDNIPELSSVKNSTPEKCKQLCVNAGEDCQGFVYSNQDKSCAIKSKIYPNAPGNKSTTGQDTYLRLPVINIDSQSGCPTGVKAVSSGFLMKDGVFSTDPVTTTYKCNDDQKIEDEQIQKIVSLNNKSDVLSKDVDGLQKENNQILSGFQEIQNRFNNQVGNYDKVNKNMKDMFDNPTASQMLRDMNHLSKTFSMRNTGIMMVIVLLAIIGLRVFKK